MSLDYKQLFETVFENDAFGMLLCNSNQEILLVNQTLCCILNYQKPELHQQALSHIIDSQDVHHLVHVLKKEPINTPLAVRLIAKTGTVFVYQVTIKQLSTEEGPLFILTFLHASQAANTLQGAELFKHLYEESPIPIVLKTTPTRKFAQANQKYCELVGYSLDELQELHVDDITHPDDIGIHIDSYQKLMQGDISYFDYEKRYIHKDGRTIWVQVFLSTLHDQKGHITQSIAMIQDISAQRRVKEEIFESEQRLRTFFDRSPLAIAIRDYDTEKIEVVNDTFCQLMGYSREEIIGQSRLIIQHSEEQEKYNHLLPKMVKGLIPSFSTIKSYKTKSGNIIWCEATRAPVYIKNKLYISTTIQDITEKLKIEQDYKNKTQILKNLIAFHPIIYYRIDPDGIVTESLGSGLKNLGLKENETVGINVFDMYGDLPHVKEAHITALAGGYTSYETELDGPNGTIYYNTITFFDQANGKGAIGLAFDVTEFKNTILALKESEERYRTIFEMSEEGMILADVQNKEILECNQAMLNMLDASKDDVMHANPLDFCPQVQPNGDSSRQKYFAILKQAASHQAPMTFEWRQITKNGKEFDAEVTVCPIIKGNQQLWLNVTRDITERKKVEQNKERIFEEQQYIFDAMPLYFFFKDTANNIIRYNNKAAEFMDASSSHSRRASTAKYYSDKANYEDDQEVIHSKKPKLGILKKIQGEKEHEPTWITTDKFPHFNEKGDVTGVLVFSKDVTDVYAAQEALKQSEAKYRDIFENVNDSIIMLDSYANVIEGNKAARLLLELEPADFINFKDLIHTDDIEQALPYFKTLKQKGAYLGLQTRIVTKSGKTKHIEVNSVAIFDEKKQFIGSKDIVRDITERMQAQQKLEASNAYLKKINAELDHFVYRASHDMRAPLSSLLGLIEVIKMNENNQDNIDLLNKMSGQINKLESFIKEIIDYSRISRTGFQIQDIDLQALLEESIEGLRFMENADKIDINIQIKGNKVIQSDKRSLDIIFNNLLSNAIKYANPSRTPYIHIHIESIAETIKIQIKDNGIGIKQELQTQIFDMFFRATDKSVGSGLGLFIVKEAIQKINGRISVESNYGEGSTFSISFPSTIENINE